MHNVKPKKHLGQHFLKDRHAAEAIVEMLQANPDDTIIEIGPGKGVLTDFLKVKYPKLELVEVDTEAIAYLKQTYEASCPPIHEGDVLKWEMAAHIPEDTYFISNLPYNISSPVMFTFLENMRFIKEGVFMVQKEVALRICSPPGNKQYGILSVLLGAYFDLTLGINVPPSAFDPPPKVQSAVFRMTRKEHAPEVDYETFKRLIKTGFNQRRKTLRNALKPLNVSWDPQHEEILKRRAETLSVEEFVGLANFVSREDD